MLVAVVLKEKNRGGKCMNQKMKMVFVNGGWMKKYKGVTRLDPIHGGGKYVKKNKFGGEILNFLAHKGYYYGGGCKPRIKRLGASPEDNHTEDILLIWGAKEPDLGGTYIVGWYEKATIYREHQSPPKNSKRKRGGWNGKFFAKTKVKNGLLLPEDKREFEIPRGRGWMGQRNLFYADKIEEGFFGGKSKHQKFREKVLAYINKIKSQRK